MGSKREDVDLEIVLKDPKCARQWIEDFNRRLNQPLKYITLNRGLELERTIYFDKMTDQEAVEAAWHLVQDFEIRHAMYESQLARELNELH